jgi:hypothetical protein
VTLNPDMGALDDLATFARIEVESRDVEPWADLLRHLYMEDGALSLEAALWLVALYNTYDSLGSACSVFARWPSPHELLTAADFPDSAQYECTQERRNLRGGLVLTRHASYGALVMGGDGTQAYWLGQGIPQPDVTTDCCDTGGAEAAWEPMTRHLRRVWGVGRQAAFEWAEFLAKVVGMRLTAPHAQLWESEGPRRSLQRLYGNPDPDRAWLDEAALECRAWLLSQGIDLSWEDFETIICDFNVMRDGRYYPGRHLAALREEIDGVAESALRAALEHAWEQVVPPEWQCIDPGIDKAKLPVYRDSGLIRSSA